jgi:hypothetical protein
MTRSLSFRWRKDLQVQLFIEFGDLALRRRHEKFGGHADEDAVVASGVVAQGISPLLGYEACVAGAGERMFEASQKLFSGGDAGCESRADSGPQRYEFFLAPQLVGEPSIAGEDHAEQWLGVEACARRQPQF